MIRTEADGATVDQKYTEGNAALSIPATIVGASEMNAIQEELAKSIERYGLTLLTRETDTQDQLYKAMEVMHTRGGRPAPVSISIVNNQASPADVTGFPTFDKTVIRAVEFLFTITRKTDSASAFETGRGYITYNSALDSWMISIMSVHDGGGLTFSTAISAGNASKLQYVSDNLAGASYAGVLTITDIKELRI